MLNTKRWTLNEWFVLNLIAFDFGHINLLAFGVQLSASLEVIP
jgi:hypothetical protein